jgi:putative flippase GtrA
MKIVSRFILTGLIALLIGSCIATQADARRFAHPRARAHVAAHNVGHINRARVANRVYRRGYRRGRWVNGVWVAGAVATGVAVGASNSCSYYWNRWHATGSGYWRDRYYANCG